jgi:cytochrome b involved in lipid metabolism
MNLRDIKKDIEYCIGAFVDDCTLFLTVHPGKQAAEITGLVDKAVDLFNDLRDKIGKPEGDKRAYYNGLRKEMLESLDGLYDQLSEAVKKGIAEK